jgi:hypothetical protein
MQGYKVEEKTAIVPPVSKLSGHPDFNQLIHYLLNVYVFHFKADNIFIQI